MNFIWKLSVKELIRNKFKVIIATIVSLILFMSAFTLCNIATALPSNFYNYYESFMNDTIGVHINNADENLYKNYSQYFTEFDINVSDALENFVLKNNLGEEQKPYKEEIVDDSVYITSYSNILLTEDSFDSEWYAQFFTPESTMWKTFDEDGIWLAQFVADNLNLRVGDKVLYRFNNAEIKLKVLGLFDSKKLQKELFYQNGSSVSEYISFVTENSAKKILFESNTPFSAYGVVGKIDKLYDTYNALSKKYSLDEGTAFALIKEVKNAEVICYIVGVIMMIGGIIILLNFINMIISTNSKHISLMRILGAKTFKIMCAYYLVFLLIISVVCLISWASLPLYNLIVSNYCAGIGYPFTIGINYAMVFSLFAVCYFIITILMIVKWQILENTTPNQNMLEED